MESTAHKISQSKFGSANNLTTEKTADCILVTNMGRRILAEIMNFKRGLKAGESCHHLNCVKCTAIHLSKIISFVKNEQPIIFVLPAFPGKSPNLAKVLGYLPDYAERLALNFLNNLCMKIKAFYKPGMKIIICSDGRVFSDVVGIQENHVTAYQAEIKRIIDEEKLSHLSLFNLDTIYSDVSFTQMRVALMKRYGQSLDFLKYKVRNGAYEKAQASEKETNQLYRGITRFLLEDSLYTGQTKSKTTLQKESRRKAYEVIRRSNAWTELIAEFFPEAIRLSIHPQACGSQKLGIRLIDNETWMTPWHGVAVITKNGHALLKRIEAEALGAKLIHDVEGRASHFELARI